MESNDFTKNLDAVEESQRQMEHYIENYPHHVEYLKWVPKVYQHYVFIMELAIGHGTENQKKRASGMLEGYPKLKL